MQKMSSEIRKNAENVLGKSSIPLSATKDIRDFTIVWRSVDLRSIVLECHEKIFGKERGSTIKIVTCCEILFRGKVTHIQSINRILLRRYPQNHLDDDPTFGLPETNKQTSNQTNKQPNDDTDE